MSKNVCVALVNIFIIVAGSAIASPLDEQSFLRENARAMDKMMRAMDAKPAGDVDEDFVNMMEPHHQGGIDMAVLELRYGKNEQLRRIAQEIIIDQQQEISAMRLALGRPLPAPDQPAQPTVPPMSDMPGMHSDAPRQEPPK